jgi:hypothetical protein
MIGSVWVEPGVDYFKPLMRDDVYVTALDLRRGGRILFDLENSSDLSGFEFDLIQLEFFKNSN